MRSADRPARTNVMDDRHLARRRAYKGISFGTTLICVGIVLLLNTLEQIDWGVWIDLARLWPILLVSLGIRLVFVNTPLHPLCLTGPALVAAAVIWTVTTYESRAGDAFSGLDVSAPALDLSCPPGAADRAGRLNIRFAAGQLRLVSEAGTGGAVAATPQKAGGGTGPAAVAAAGFEGRLRYEGREPRRSCSSGDLWLGRIEGDDGIHVILPFSTWRNRWDAKLSAASPIDVSAKIAAATADLDFRSFHVEELEMETAASHVAVHLGPPRGRVPVRIEGAVSSLEIVLPEGTCYTVTRQRVFNVLELDDVSDWPRRARRLTSDACGRGAGSGGTAGAEMPRYEISYELPISRVSVETEPAGI